jgi:hypothetical protein
LATCLFPGKVGDCLLSKRLATILLTDKVGDLPSSQTAWRPAFSLTRLATCLFPGKDGEDAIGPLHLHAVGSVCPAVQQNLQKARKLIVFHAVNFKK